MYKHILKRTIDFTIALLALLVIWPFLLIITIWLHFANKGAGAFFLQERPGKDEKKFKIIKFKTMTDERDEKGNLLPDRERLTRVGKFVRSTSIDELPQLINVLKGDMSFIGPRPITTDYLLVFNNEQRRRHNVKPGITGLAQINGRNNCKLSKKFEWDVWYVDNYCISLDVKIIYKTIVNVIKRKDIGEGASDMSNIDDLHISERLKEIYSKK